MSEEELVKDVENLVWELGQLRDREDFPGSPEELLYLRLSSALDTYQRSKK